MLRFILPRPRQRTTYIVETTTYRKKKTRTSLSLDCFTFFLSPHRRSLGRRRRRKTTRGIPPHRRRRKTTRGIPPQSPPPRTGVLPNPSLIDLRATLIEAQLDSRRSPVPSLTRSAARRSIMEHAPGEGERHAASVPRLAGGSFSLGGGNRRHGGFNTSGIGSATASAAHFVDF
jgi:hypothetical protein